MNGYQYLQWIMECLFIASVIVSQLGVFCHRDNMHNISIQPRSSAQLPKASISVILILGVVRFRVLFRTSDLKACSWYHAVPLSEAMSAMVTRSSRANLRRLLDSARLTQISSTVCINPILAKAQDDRCGEIDFMSNRCAVMKLKLKLSIENKCQW